MAGYIRNLIHGVIHPSETLANALTGAATSAGQQLAHSLQGGHGSEIDTHIDYLSELLKNRTFYKANGATASVQKEQATLEDFIHHLDQITTNSQHLFGIDFTDASDASIVSHKRPFVRLKEQLTGELDHLRTHPNEAGKQLDPATVHAASATLGQLRTLKQITSGSLTTTKMTLSASPELSSLFAHLGGLQQELTTQKIPEARATCEALNAAIDTALERKTHIFIGKDLTAQDEATLRRLQALALSYSVIPDSLKYTRLFNPSEMELIGVITQTAQALQGYIQEQTGSLTSLIETLKKAGKEAISSSFPTSSSNNITSYSSLEKLQDAIRFIQGPGLTYPDDQKHNALLTLLNSCEPVFKDQILDIVGQTHPDLLPGAPSDRVWAEAHLLEDLAFLQGAFNTALREYARRHHQEALDNAALLVWSRKQPGLAPAAAPATTPHQGTHALMDYVQAALTFIQGKGTFTECAVPAIGKTFQQLLSSEMITAWIAKQPEGNRAIFEQIRTSTLSALRSATNAAGYEAALREFQTQFNAQHWILEGFELPILFQDSAEKLAQAQTVQELEGTLSTLRRELDRTKVKQDINFDWNNDQKAQAKIKEQLNTFSDNLQDHLTYQFIYQKLVGANNPADNTFYHIKALQKAQPLNKTKIFIRELKTAINNSDASWITKAFAKLILSISYSAIGYYVRNIIHNFYNNFNTHIKKLDKGSILTRSSHCFSKYNALLKHWANLPHGGDKIPAVNRLMATKDYLEYENQSYDQDRLYTEVSNAFVNEHLHLLYTSDGQDTSLRAKLNTTTTKLNQFILRRPLYPRNAAASFINYLSMGFKALFIGLPVHTFLLISRLIVVPFTWISNSLTRLIARKSLSHFKVLDTAIRSTRQGVYEDNPYVHAITNFLADQLETLSKTLDNPTPATTESTDSQSIASENSRAKIKKTLEHLFELLDKDRFQTQEQLLAHLRGSIGQTVSKQLDSLILPGTIEALIDLTLTISESVLTEKSLRQPISLLLDQLNDVISAPPSPQSSPTDRLKHKAAEEKLHKYADKILHQVIKLSVDKTFDSFGQEEAKRAENTVKWVKEETPKLLDQWETILADVAREDKSNKERYDILEGLVTASDAFLAEVQNRHDLLNANPSRTSKEMATKLLEIVAPLKTLLTGTDPRAPGGLLSLYANYNHLHKDQSDLPYVTTCLRCYNTVQQGLQHLVHQINNSQLKEMVFSNSYLFQQTLSDLASGKLVLLKDFSHYAAVKALLTDNTLKQRAIEMQYIEHTLVPNFTMMQAIAPSPTIFDTIRVEKIAQIDRYRRDGFWALFRSSRSDAWTGTYNLIFSQIQCVPNKEARETLAKAFKAIHQSKSHSTATTNTVHFQNLWNQYMNTERNKLIAATQRLSHIDEPIYDAMQQLKENFDTDLATRVGNNADLIPQIRAIIAEMRGHVARLEDVPFVTTNIGVIENLKKYPAGITYRQLKPKMDGFVDLVRNGGFSQFFVNHLLFMPMVHR